MSERRIRLLLFGTVACLLLLFQEGAITGSDGQSMYQVTRSIVEDGDLTIDASVGVPGRGGASYSKYGIGLPLVALPAYLLARPIAAIVPADRDAVTQAAVASTMPLVSAALVVVLYALGRRLGARALPAVLVSIGAVLGTYALPYTKELFSEPLAALGIAWAAERLLAKRPAAAGAALALACLTRPQTFALAPVLPLVAWRIAGARGAARAALPLGGALAASLAYNVARSGDLLEFGYGAEPGFTTPLLRGMRDLLLHPAESILLFAPVVVLLPFAFARLWRTHRPIATLLVANLLVTFALSATWWSWAGGWSWGPRLLLPGVIPTLPALAPWLTAHRRRRRAALALFALGAAISLPALLVSTRAQQLDRPPPAVGPGVARQYALVLEVTAFTLRHAEARDDGDHRRYLSLWQVGAVGELGTAGLLAAAVGSALLLAGAAVGARRLRRAVGRTREAAPG